jgi:hypothetical protein
MSCLLSDHYMFFSFGFLYTLDAKIRKK